MAKLKGLDKISDLVDWKNPTYTSVREAQIFDESPKEMKYCHRRKCHRSVIVYYQYTVCYYTVITSVIAMLLLVEERLTSVQEQTLKKGKWNDNGTYLGICPVCVGEPKYFINNQS